MASGIDRKFLTWPYSTPDGRDYTLEVRYKQQREDAKCSIIFYVKHLEEPLFMEEDTDLERLRQKITERLDAMDHLHWESWLMVVLNPTEQVSAPAGMHWKVQSLHCQGLNFSVYPYQQVLTGSGQVFWRYQSKGTFPSWYIESGMPYDPAKDKPLGEFGKRRGVCCVPDTPEVRAKLAAITESIPSLAERLVAILNKTGGLEELQIQTLFQFLQPQEKV